MAEVASFLTPPCVIPVRQFLQSAQDSSHRSERPSPILLNAGMEFTSPSDCGGDGRMASRLEPVSTDGTGRREEWDELSAMWRYVSSRAFGGNGPIGV